MMLQEAKEQSVPTNIRRNIKRNADQALDIIGKSIIDESLSVNHQGPLAVVKNVGPLTVMMLMDKFIFNWRDGVRPPAGRVKDAEHGGMLFGALWGEQLVRLLGFHWTYDTSSGDEGWKALRVCSPDGSQYVKPIETIQRSLESRIPTKVTVLTDWVLKGINVG